MFIWCGTLFLRRMELFVRSSVREVLNHIKAILIANQSDRSQAVGQGRAGQFAKTPPKCARGIVSLPQCRLCGASRTQVGHSATSAMCQCTKSLRDIVVRQTAEFSRFQEFVADGDGQSRSRIGAPYARVTSHRVRMTKQVQSK